MSSSVIMWSSGSRHFGITAVIIRESLSLRTSSISFRWFSPKRACQVPENDRHDDADTFLPHFRPSLINWVHRSTRGWSMGGSVIDPRTGEISIVIATGKIVSRWIPAWRFSGAQDLARDDKVHGFRLPVCLLTCWRPVRPFPVRPCHLARG
jgi:hypothetical protein